jgi:hypothetical protein
MLSQLGNFDLTTNYTNPDDIDFTYIHDQIDIHKEALSNPDRRIALNPINKRTGQPAHIDIQLWNIAATGNSPWLNTVLNNEQEVQERLKAIKSSQIDANNPDTIISYFSRTPTTLPSSSIVQP